MRPLILLLSLLNSYLPQTLCEGSFCDAEKCINTQPLEAWFETVKDPKSILKSDGIEGNLKIDAQPLVRIVPCDTKDALWNYKYAGSKGKRKIFTGKGKITFVKVKDPPHGYDYGMKSGHCLIKNDEQLKSIESEFDAKGRVQGFVKIDYFNKTRVYSHCVDGVMHGITRVFIDEIDEETNLPKSEKRLSTITTIQNGKPVGSMWTFALNGMKIYQKDPEHADAIIFLQDESNEDQIISGLLDDDEMVVKAHDAHIKLMTNENGIFKLEVKKYGEMFDYDMQIKEKTDAKLAKMIRFFEYVTIEKNKLESKYQPLEEPVELKNAQYLISDHTTISGSAMSEQLYKMKCPYDPSGICIAKSDGVKPFDSEATLVMYSQLTYQILADRGLVNITNLLAANVSEETFGDFLPLDVVSGLISDNSIRSIQGKFKDGKAEGPVEINFMNGKTMQGVAKDGALHGIARILETSRPIRLRSRYIARTKINGISGISWNSEDKVREVSHCGIFSNGYVSGPAWSFLHGGNFHFGMIQEPIISLTNFTTENGAYINQDMISAYSGKFLDGKMISGQESKITDLLHENGVVVPIFDELKGPVFNEITFDQETLIGGLTPDPLEERYVYVNHSVNGLGGMDGGKGLFAKVDIPANTVFAYFGGYLYTASAWNQTDFFDPSYFIKFKEGPEDYFVHLPDEFGDDLNKYAATLGHKINHGWNHNCLFVANNHPRFGLIAAAKSVREIKTGNEILGYYNLKFHEAQPWYQEMWRTMVDLDTPEGPFGHREHKKVQGQAIHPMLTDSQLYKEFYNYALAELKLDPLT